MINITKSKVLNYVEKVLSKQTTLYYGHAIISRKQIENCISDSLKAQFIAHEFQITEGQRNVLTNEIIEQFWALSYPIHATLPSITDMNLQMTFQQLKEHFNKRIENLKVELKLTE